MGLQFENLIVNNYASLIPHLHLGNSLIESAAPYRRKSSAANEPGVQVDFLLQTRHNNYIIEIRCQREIGRDVIDEVRARLAKIRKSRGRSNRPVLVYEGHLAPIVETEGYFGSLVSFRALLGVMPRYLRKTVEKYEAEENPQASAISVMFFSPVFSRSQAFWI